MIRNPQGVSLNSATALPSSSTSNPRNRNLSSTEPQSGSTASRQSGTATEAKVISFIIQIIINVLINYNLLQTQQSVLRLYSVGKFVTFTMLADFVSQCGPLIWMQTETSKNTNTKTTFVELGVKPSVAEAFVKKWLGKCRLNNSNFTMSMSHHPTITNKSDTAKVF
jgi:hypothetical protein